MKRFPLKFLGWGWLSLFFSGLICFSNPSRANTFLADVPKGVFALEDFKHPVYLFVPEQYQAERPYALIISVPAAGESPEKHLKEWESFATSSSVIIAVPTFSARDSDVPYRTDEWILRLKKEVMNRYRIASTRVFLAGKGKAAHYAAYLGIKYPEEFSGVALLNGAWKGPYQSLMRYQKRPVKQLPFFVALKDTDAALLAQIEKDAYKLEKKGYPIYLEKLEPQEVFESKEFKKRMLKWLDEKSESWQSVIAESQKSVKEKIYRTIERNFTLKGR